MDNETIRIDLAKDFGDTPGGRLREDGEFSGEEFRERFLEPHFADKSKRLKIIIELDGAFGYATSFLEEAFGGLARKFDPNRVLQTLEFVSQNDILVSQIKEYIRDARRKA